MTHRPIIIIGAGGHARVVADALISSGREVLGFTDTDSSKYKTFIDGLPILGDDATLTGKENEIELANGLGSIGKPDHRRNLFERLIKAGFHFTGVTHPYSFVSNRAQISGSAQIMAGAIVQAGARIGDNVIVNTGARIDHDCEIGAHSHVAPGAVLSGAVRVSIGCHIGPGAVIVQGIHLSEETVVGAGAVVTQNHPAGTTLIGIPARSRT